MIAEEILDNLSVRSQRKAEGHAIQRVDELGCNAGEFRFRLEACCGLGFAVGLAFRFGFGFEGGLGLDSGRRGDLVVGLGDGFFDFRESLCHGADLIDRWLG